ncbi:MAG: hypothetical protein K0S76_1760 [Herbinix sp.]|nr:hypothetical protein [Herbinix sp.]
MTNDNVSDFTALQRWNKIPKEFRELLLANVFCGNCGVTAIQPGYTIHELSHGDIRLKGKCMKCGKDVSRVVEAE